MDLADRAGLTPSYLGGVERGSRNPSLDVLVSIAEALDVPLGAVVSPDEFRVHRDLSEFVEDLAGEQRMIVLTALRDIAGTLRAALASKRRPGR